MDIDTSSDQSGTLVAQANQANSTTNLVDRRDSDRSSSSSLNNLLITTKIITSDLGNSSQLDNSVLDNSVLDKSVDNDNQIDNPIKRSFECNQMNGCLVEDTSNNLNQIPKSDEAEFRQTTIEKLGLQLDYQTQTSLADLDKQSTTSLNSQLSSTQKSESQSSRANSPCSSQRSLPYPPAIRKLNTSETNLIVNDPDSKDEQLRFFKIERKNLIHLASLIINDLINNISPLTKTLECHENVVLYDFFSITELILKHALKARKGLIFGKKELWHVFESIENINPQIIEIVQNIRELPNVRTNNGRVKAFLRLAFVHKVFNEVFTYLISCKELLRSFYEDGAFILSNEIDQFLAKTEQLKDFDFRWCAKDDKLDELSNLIDLTNYLVDKDRTTKEIVYKVNINKNQLKELIEEKQFYEGKSKEFRNKILFYYNRIKELEIESLFESEIKNPSKVELLTKKLNELFKSPVEKLASEQCPDVQSLQEDIATLKKQLEIELSNRVSKEAALEYIESDVLVKQDENIVMRHQIEEVRTVNEDLCAKVGELGQLNADLNSKILSLTSKNQQLVSTVTELQRNLVATEAKYGQLSATEKLLRKQFEELQKSNESLKAKALQEQEEKNTLQKKLDENIERNSTVLTELNIAKNRSNEYPSLKKKHDMLVRRCREYEQTCEEIGQKLANAQLEIENLKEQSITYSEAVWKDDKEVNKCEGCSALFSVKIRKHHCRNCGSIFCSSCSDRKIALPSDSKPCRVCDTCYTKLMSRYNG